MKSLIADVHRHLGGCIPPEFIWDIIKSDSKYGYLASSLEDVIELVTCDVHDRSMISFLNKFKILDEINWTEELIDASIKQIVDRMKSEGLYGALIDFSINKYMKIGWHKKEAIKFIKESFDKYKDNIKIGLVLSIKYESPPTTIKQYMEVIEDPEIAECLVGIDFVGNEHFYDKDLIQKPLQAWAKYGKMTRVHVGEAGPIDNIRSAIEDLEVTNIAHGIKILQDQYLMSLAVNRDIQFDLGLIGNYYTGVSNTHDHPISDMIYNGLKVTIGTDDPVQFSTDIYSEFALLKKIYKYNDVERVIEDVRLNAVETIDRLLPDA